MSKGDQLANALRGAVRATFAASDWDNLTVRRIRGNVELSLGLAPNYFKSDAAWKEKSKSIIEDEVVCANNSHISIFSCIRRAVTTIICGRLIHYPCTCSDLR